MFVADDYSIASQFDDGYPTVFAGLFQFGMERHGYQTKIKRMAFIIRKVNLFF